MGNSSSTEQLNNASKANTCENCDKTLEPPIFLCSTGHSICHECKSSKHCKTCSSEITLNRNLKLESLLQYFLYPCTNKECTESVFLKDMQQHMDNCSYNAYDCPIECRMIITSVKALMTHLTEIHQIEIKSEHTFNISGNRSAHFYLKYNSKCFFAFNVKLETKYVKADVQFYGPKSNIDCDLICMTAIANKESIIITRRFKDGQALLIPLQLLNSIDADNISFKIIND